MRRWAFFFFQLWLLLPRRRPVKKKLTIQRMVRVPQRRFSWQAALLLTCLTLTLGIGLTAYLGYEYVFKDLPSALELTSREQQLSSKILDRNGQLLYTVYEDENRTLVPLSALPPSVLQATIAIEDKDYYEHHGFSLSGITRAFMANLNGEKVQGGSTITQQLVKLRLLSSERTLQRKLKEAVLSIIVNNTYSKDQVLEMYLNEVSYGGSTYGIEEAAQRYFGKPAVELTLAESSLLAGLPVAPSVYSPFGPNPEMAYQRRAEVLRRMSEDGYITPEQAAEAQAEKLLFKSNTVAIQAPHFVMYVRKLLAEQYGEDVLNKGGLEVRTTLDLALQNETQTIVTTELDELRPLKISNGAALVTNPETGEILSMVGSANYYDFANDGQVNVVLRPRQPGSSIKPLTYAIALENGMTPSSTIDDSYICYQTPGSEEYCPRNYDGKFHGRVSLRESLASSYNIPAVKLLATIGINNLIDKGQELGISTWTDRSRFGLSLTLGGGEVRMLDLASMYGTFANDGYTIPPTPFLEIKDNAGKVLYKNTCALEGKNCETRKTVDSRAAYQITSILSDNVARAPAFGSRSVLDIPGQEVAVKTGTTNNLRDNWTIGYTNDRLVAVWVGNNNNTPMSYVASGITGASPIWNNIMRLFLDEEDPHQFAEPEGMIKVRICATTGTLPCTGCPVIKEELFYQGSQPTKACVPSQFSSSTPAPTETPARRNRILQGQNTRR
ncbi:MAG: PBP1A family penicillin-binding protein [bacterium]|nr:PBP1A family penicillin-binding protein [bacterium]